MSIPKLTPGQSGELPIDEEFGEKDPVETEVLGINSPEYSAWLKECLLEPGASLLLGGERRWCCDEVVVAREERKIVSVGTIAPEGEQQSGQPTIVAIYTQPDKRRKGYGTAVQEATIRRCLQRGFDNIRIDVLTKAARRRLEVLPKELKEHLDIHYYEVPDYFEL